MGVASALVMVQPSPAQAVDGETVSVVVALNRGENPRVVAAEYERRGAVVSHIYGHLRGFAATMSSSDAARIRSDARTAAVAPDAMAYPTAVQSPTPSWGLDRVDQHPLPLSGSYSYVDSGAGVKAYVVDSGIRRTHVDFSGRVAAGHDATGTGTTDDCSGHGTHVAGTVGGSSFGVAKAVTIVPVRVFACSGGSPWSVVAAGLDWIAADHGNGAAAVANLSLSGDANAFADQAVQRVIDDGVTVVVSAGNNNRADACAYSPARVASAITVAATTSTDGRASYSNLGACIDVFAPGSSIVSAGISSDTASATKSGTSMAAPHVAGIAALWWTRARPADVATAVTGAATVGVVTGDLAGSPNRLAYSLVDGVAPPPATAPPAPTITSVAALRRAIQVSWQPNGDGGSPITSYTVQVSSGALVVKTTTVAAGTTSTIVSGLKANKPYTARVSATNAIGTSEPSVPSAVVTPTA